MSEHSRREEKRARHDHPHKHGRRRALGSKGTLKAVPPAPAHSFVRVCPGAAQVTAHQTGADQGRDSLLLSVLYALWNLVLHWLLAVASCCACYLCPAARLPKRTFLSLVRFASGARLRFRAAAGAAGGASAAAVSVMGALAGAQAAGAFPLEGSRPD